MYPDVTDCIRASRIPLAWGEGRGAKQRRAGKIDSVEDFRPEVEGARAALTIGGYI